VSAAAASDEHSRTGKWLRFLMTGGLNTALSYAVYLLLLPVTGYTVAYVAAFIAGLLLSLMLSLKWVFRVPPTWRRIAAYPLVYVPQLLLGVVMNQGLIERIGVDPRISVLIVIAVTVPLNYLIAARILRRGDDER
jgi:putative flippase GtrA